VPFRTSVKFKKSAIVALLLLTFLLSWRYGWSYEARVVRESKRLRTVEEVHDFVRRHNLSLNEIEVANYREASYVGGLDIAGRGIFKRRELFAWISDNQGSLIRYQRYSSWEIFGKSFSSTEARDY
jgi:hypothetical protein